MKKILFVINTLGRAGAENAMTALMRRLSPEEYDISLLVLTGQGELRKELPEYVKLLNSSFRDCPVSDKEGRRRLKKTCIKALFHKGNIFRRFGYLAGNFFRMLTKGGILPDKLMWRVLADNAERFSEEYDLAVAYLEGGSTYYIADYVKAKKKAAFVHVNYALAGYSAELDGDCYDRIDRIFAVSEDVRESFIKIHDGQKDKVSIFHNLTDDGLIRLKAEERVDFDEDFDGFRILTIGRLTAQKSIEVSVGAMKILKEQGVNARWYVLGEGERHSTLEKLIASKGLQKEFILWGAVDNPYPYIKRCSLYVHATGFEGESLAIREARVLGKAVIASNCSGNRNQVENGRDGLLCALDPASVAGAVEKLIRNSDLREKFERASLSKVTENSGDIRQLTEML